MTYKKPPNLSYTDMAIWIDNNIQDENIDIDTLYQYLYHLINMLAHKNDYYSCAEDYDSFSLFVASKIYNRITSKRCEYRGRKVKNIKSILNYLKKVLYYYKGIYDKNFINKYNNIIDDKVISNIVDFQEILEFDKFSFASDISTIPHICSSFLCKIPKKKNSEEWLNIYLSCLLTLLSSMTPPCNLDEKSMNKFDYANKILDKMRDEEPILYHLDASMSGYIKVLVNELRSILCQNLSYQCRANIGSDSYTRNIIADQLE